MVIKRLKRQRAANNVDIAHFNAAGTPALIGYWKCDEGSGDTVYDYSGNGFHLSIVPSEESSVGFGTTAAMWAHRPGWLSLKNGDKAIIENINGTALDTGSACLVMSCEMVNGTVLDDTDFGTAWKVTEAPTGGYRGLSISTLGSVQVGRASIFDEGNGGIGHTDLVYVQSGVGDGPVNSPTVISTAFVSADSVRTVVNDGALQSEAHAYTSLELTNNSFALKAAYNAPGTTITGSSVRNFSVWTFASEPSGLDLTLAWMSLNPGKLPKWWEGR